MPDISKCRGDNCPLAFNCYRHTVKGDRYGQSYFGTAPWDEEKKTCDYYLPNEKIQIKTDDK